VVVGKGKTKNCQHVIKIRTVFCKSFRCGERVQEYRRKGKKRTGSQQGNTERGKAGAIEVLCEIFSPGVGGLLAASGGWGGAQGAASGDTTKISGPKKNTNHCFLPLSLLPELPLGKKNKGIRPTQLRGLKGRKREKIARNDPEEAVDPSTWGKSDAKRYRCRRTTYRKASFESKTGHQTRRGRKVTGRGRKKKRSRGR